MKQQPQLDYYEMGADVVAFSSTRHGGYSKGSYASFNINRYCGDLEEDIRKNREALCQVLGISKRLRERQRVGASAGMGELCSGMRLRVGGRSTGMRLRVGERSTGIDRLIMPHQVHETKVAMVDETFMALSEDDKQAALEGVDALMTNLSEVCIGVSTADCIPLLLYDKEKHAVCAIHAGWRGTVKRIVEKAVKAMTDAYGTQPQQLIAQIGPGIHLDSFEVGDEVYDAFDQAGFDMPAISVKKEKWHIDLPECNRLQLVASGLLPQNIKVSPVCTFQQSADYFSARRLGINSGRIFTGIIIR